MTTFKNLFHPDNVGPMTHEILTSHGLRHERFEKGQGGGGNFYRSQPDPGEPILKKFHPHLTSIGWKRHEYSADNEGRSLSTYHHQSDPEMRLQVATLSNFIGVSMQGPKV